MVDVNLTGVFPCSRDVAREMIVAGNGGSIINIAPILGAGALGPAAATVYAATKGAAVNLTRDLAIHWAPHNIRINALGPASFPSEMTAGLVEMPEVVAEIERRTPMNRMGRPDEVKGTVVFLASDAASSVTGDILYIDGGRTAWWSPHDETGVSLGASGACRTLVRAALGSGSGGDGDGDETVRGLRELLVQPFFVTESYTSQPGTTPRLG